MLKKLLFAAGLVFSVSIAPIAKADIVAESVLYDIEDQAYEGYFVQNEGFGENQPIIVLIHDWDGLGEYERRRANMLATQGFTVFAIDLYGRGVRPETTEESRRQSSQLYEDRERMRSRLFAGLEQAKRLPGVNPENIAAIGYCFGGASVLEMARAGADLDAFVVFHGSLDTPEGQDYSDVEGPILLLHGSNDPVAPMEQVAALATQMNEAGVSYRMEIYGGAKHAFTVWNNSDQYDPQADIQSWAEMSQFLEDKLR